MRKNRALFKACIDGDKERVIQMIKKGANNFEDALYYSYSEDHQDIVEMLIEKDLYSLNCLNYMLLLACTDRHKNLVKLLIKKGANDFRRLGRITDSLEIQRIYIKNRGDFNKDLYDVLVEDQCPLYYIITHKHVSKTLNKIPMDLWRYLKDFLN